MLEDIRTEQKDYLKSIKRNEAQDKWLKQVTENNGVRRLLPYGYIDGQDNAYKRLVPINDTEQKTSILNLRQELRTPLLKRFQEEVLPEGWMMAPIDITSCHAAIFAGIGGELQAPETIRGLRSGRFWDFAMEQSIVDAQERKLKKSYLKTIFYKALNGGSLKTEGNIIESIQEKNSLNDEDAFQIAQEIMGLPVIGELRNFQVELGKREYIYLPSQELPFAGRNRSGYAHPDITKRPSRSEYHAGLMTSRVFAGVEIIFIIAIAKMLMEREMFPVNVEHDGLLVLARERIDVQEINERLGRIGEVLIGMPVKVEVKE